MTEHGYELGPIRPPSEAMSLLVRVSRNCPWNKCAFCPVYKGDKYSRRTVEEVHADLDALREFHGDGPRTVFLQDADPLLGRPADLVEIIEGVRTRFPNVSRITTYARSKTLARRSDEDLVRIREAGLDRIHVGLESGSDAVLRLVEKGVTAKEQVAAGRKAVKAGFELSLYVMPGLGGREHTEDHADATARAVAAIEPNFTRLRTTAAAPGTPLFELCESGAWTPLTEIETVVEIRRFVAGLGEARTRLESDHSLNLLMELRGDLPDAREDLLGICDRLLAMPDEEQGLFIIARRAGRATHLAHMDRTGVRDEALATRDRMRELGMDVDALAEEMRRRMV